LLTRVIAVGSALRTPPEKLSPAPIVAAAKAVPVLYTIPDAGIVAIAGLFARSL
jgi:hypothetical protein